jgi:hypothetical protein
MHFDVPEVEIKTFFYFSNSILIILTNFIYFAFSFQNFLTGANKYLIYNLYSVLIFFNPGIKIQTFFFTFFKNFNF